MSSQPPSNGTRAVEEPVEDCRDYLRTGRCKYGASCKFNHPPNVQSGGGIKGPIDPSEPRFPVRPNEPMCQYYLKHGTCKFGQACKFHHPPQAATKSVFGPNTVIVNGDGTNNLSQQILLNTGGDINSTMMLQFLPQRPDEQDCLYFLRNGRCKYGATCRYHHPVGYHQLNKPSVGPIQIQVPAQIASDGTVLAGQIIDATPNVQFVTSQQGRSSGSFHQHQRSGTSHRIVGASSPGHIVISETGAPIRIVSGVGTAHGAAHKFANVVKNDPGEYDAPIGVSLRTTSGLSQVSQEQKTSSSSSISSSYETALSSLEHISVSRQESSGQWNRAMRSASGGNLSAYGASDGARLRNMQTPNLQQGGGIRNLVVSESESSLATNRTHRAPSFGSMGDSSDASGHIVPLDPPGQGWHTGSLPTYMERGSWMNHRGSHEQYRSRGGYTTRAEGPFGPPNEGHQEFQPRQSVSSHQRASNVNPRRAGSRRHQAGEGVDQGFSMMTSALLHMLDTPEEAEAKMNPSRETSSSTLASPPLTPRLGKLEPQTNPTSLDEKLMPPSAAGDGGTGHQRDPRYLYGGGQAQPEERFWSQHHHHHVLPGGTYHRHIADRGDTRLNRGYDHHGSMPLLNPSGSGASNTAQDNNSDVGLYLP